MQRRWRAGAVLIGVVVVAVGACDAGEMMADAMVDAGELVRDAGDAMIDASGEVRDGAGDDARAQPPTETVISMEVPCDIMREEVLYDDGTNAASDPDAPLERRYSNWYAEYRSPSLTQTNVVAMSAIGCGERPPAQSQCAGTFATTCTGDRPYDPLPCRSFPVELDDGVARVVCGSGTAERTELSPGVFSEWSGTSAPPVTTVRIRLTVTE